MKKFLYLFLFIQSSFCISQVSFNETEVMNGHTYDLESFKDVADINNDGYPEIFISTDNDFTPNYDFYYLLNVNGDLKYSPRIYQEPSSNIYMQYLLDIDNDGLNDLVGIDGNSGRHYYWLKNLGNNNFSDGWQSIIESNIDYDSSDLFYDYNNDGYYDYFLTTSQGEVFRYKNLQGNGFSNPELVFYTDDTFLGSIEEIRFMDFNQDGKEDLLVRSFFTDFNLYLNSGNDHFEYHIPIEDQAYENRLHSFDYDGNSLNDFVIYDENSLKIRTFFYDDEDEEYYFQDELIDNPFTHVLSNVFVISRIVDFNQDGLMDIFITTGPDVNSYANLYYYENLGNQEFAEKELIKENLYGHFEFLFTDLNLDNELDILMIKNNTNFSDRIIYAFYNEGNLNFKEEIVEQNIGTSDKTFFVDINNDDKIDIVNGKSNLIWYENRGENDWSGRRFIPSLNKEVPYYKDYIFLDIDNDNLPDVIKNESIEQNNVSNTFSVFKNLGNLEFERVYYLENDYQNRWYNYETFTNGNDNFPDVYFLMPPWNPNTESSIYIIKNNNGIFEEPVQAVIQSDEILFNPNNYDFDLADLNNDGLPEIIYFSLFYDGQVNHQLSYLENLGNDTFRKKTIDTSWQNIGRQAFPLDYDLDGDHDIIIGKQYGTREFSVYENEDMVFTKKIIDENVIVDDVLIHDINNDGLLDILTIGYYGWNEPEYSYQYLIFYYENNGNGQYEKFLINQFTSYFSNDDVPDRGNIYLYDKNLDGKLDILVSCSDNANTIKFYLNTSNLEVQDLDNNKNQTQVFPNPFSDTINWKSIQSKNNYDIQIYDLTGKKVYNKTLKTNHLDLSFLEKGIYILKIDGESFKIIKK